MNMQNAKTNVFTLPSAMAKECSGLIKELFYLEKILSLQASKSILVSRVNSLQGHPYSALSMSLGGYYQINSALKGSIKALNGELKQETHSASLS